MTAQPQDRRSGLDRRTGSATAAREAQRLREVLHDISHQLATARLQAERLRREQDPDRAPGTWRQLDEALGFLGRLTRGALVTDEPGAATSVHAVACATLGSVALHPGVVVALSGTETAFVMAEPDQLRRALANLVQNACRAVGDVGRVEIEITRAARTVRIRVDDDGPSFGHAPSGTASLGLRAVHRFATDAGGRLEVGRSQRGGASVALVLPLADAFAPTASSV